MSFVFQDTVTPGDAAHFNALQQKVEKGVVNGYASLDSGGKVPTTQLPAIGGVDYIGAWGGRPFLERYGKYLLIRPHELELADRFFEKYGPAK